MAHIRAKREYPQIPAKRPFQIGPAALGSDLGHVGCPYWNESNSIRACGRELCEASQQLSGALQNARPPSLRTREAGVAIRFSS